MKRRARNKPPPPPPDGKCPILSISILCGIVVILHAAASFFPRGRIWGFNQWAYFPPFLSLSLGALILLMFVPQANERLRHLLHLATTLVLAFPRKIGLVLHKRVWFALGGVLFSVPFWLLRDRTHFLGDGAQIISRMNLGELTVKWSEPLDIYLHIQTFLFAHGMWQLDAATVYALLSCITGVLFIFMLFLFADFLGDRRLEKVLVFLVLLAMGSIQLFFGYVEHYAFMFLFTAAYVFSSLAYLEDKLRWFVPVGAWLLASLSHVMGLWLLPSLLYLFFSKSGDGKWTTIRRVSIVIAGALILGLGIVLYRINAWAVPPIFVPLSVDTYAAPGYLLFSVPHILDLINQHLLISPAGPALILAPLICLALGSLVKSKLFRFLLAVSLCQLLFHFLVDPGLGAPRDWDLFSMVGLGYTVLGLFLLLRMFRDRTGLAYSSIILVSTALYSTAPWIAIQANQNKSVKRFENVLSMDVKRSYSGHFVLLKYFESRGMDRQAEERTEKYREAFPELALIANASSLAKSGEMEKAKQMFLEAERLAPKLPQVHNNLGKVYLDLGELGNAENQLKSAIRLASFLPDAYVNLADLYFLRSEYDSALTACKKAIRLDPRYAGAYSDAGTIYLMKEELQSAERQFRKLISLDSTAVMGYLGLGDVYSRQAQLEKALHMYQRAVGLDPKLDIARYRLGMTYLSLGLPNEAREQLEAYLQISPQGAHAQEVTRTVEQLRQQEQNR
jgi:tetratricopeptide (TPR) repeat protein